MGARKNGTRKGNMRGESLRRALRSFLPPTRVLSRIYRLLPSGRRPKLPRGVRWHGPPEIFVRWDAICCILRHNFEKCCSVRTDLIASGWLFRYSYLYSVTLTKLFFWGGEAGHLGGGGAKHNLTMASTTVHGTVVCKKPIRFTLQKFPDGTSLPNEFELLKSNHQIFVGT